MSWPFAFECSQCYCGEVRTITFHVTSLVALLRHAVKDVDVCVALLDHLRHDLPNKSSLKSERYKFFRGVMDDKVGVDAR